MDQNQIQQMYQHDIEKKEKLSAKAHILCGWPLRLVFIGGAIGGGLGGLAYGLNIAIYKSNLSNNVKIVLNILIGVTAIILWFVIAMLITGATEE